MPGLELTFGDAACAAALDDQRLLRAMARFEAALVQAAARCGLATEQEAKLVGEVCGRIEFDPPALAAAARQAGALAIPFVKELKARVAAVSASAAEQVHAGATSQDVADTALALCLKEAMERVDSLAVRLGDRAAALSRRHASTIMAGRTLLQPALPITFGLKAAGWLAMLSRALPPLRAATAGACVLQFGGPAGTLSAYGDHAQAMQSALAKELGLDAPALPWHSGRDAFARLGAELAVLAGIAAKIGRDVSLLMQAEVGEAAEASPGGSSSMAHKRNPAKSLLALEAGLRAPGLAATLLAQLSPEHERGLGQWQSQWLTLRELACAAASGLAAMSDVLEGLQVDEAAMLANLGRSAIPAEEKARGAGAAAKMIEAALARWAATRGTSP